jgi:prepilin-type N-terminal cleavage/methylation domain-containing protein
MSKLAVIVDTLRRRLAGEGGFTLIELIVASAIGTIVIMAAYMVLDRSTVLQAEVANRTDALQRGRLGLELMTRELRSQVCLGSATEPITNGQDQTVSFYADTGDGTTNPEERRLTYYPTATTRADGLKAPAKSIVEDRYTGTGTYPALTFSGYPNAPSRARVIATGIAPVQVSGVDQPIFQYFEFDDTKTDGTMDKLSTPLSTADVPQVVMVKVQFVAQPDKKFAQNIKAQDSVSLDGEAYVRSADPNDPKDGPKCL